MELLEDTKTMRGRWIGLLEEQLEKLGELTSSIPQQIDKVIKQSDKYFKLRGNVKHIIGYNSKESLNLFGEFLSIMNGLPFDPDYKTRGSPDCSW